MDTSSSRRRWPRGSPPDSPGPSPANPPRPLFAPARCTASHPSRSSSRSPYLAGSDPPSRSSSSGWRCRGSGGSRIAWRWSVDETQSSGPGCLIPADLNRVQTLIPLEGKVRFDHQGIFVRELLRLRGLDGRGLGPVMQALRMMGDECLPDAGSREELPLVIEQHLVLVDVRVEEGHPEGGGIAGLRRARGEQADLEPVALPDRVDRRRDMVARRHHGTEVLLVQPDGAQITLPAHDVEGVEGEGQRGVPVIALDPNPELSLLVVG